MAERGTVELHRIEGRTMEPAKFEGKAYLAPSGEWSWVIFEDGDDIARGAGYATEDEAIEDMESELAQYAT
jgi:hypothetical protein